MSTAVSVTQLQKLVDGGQLTAQDIAAKVQSGEIELHDDRGTQAAAPQAGMSKGEAAAIGANLGARATFPGVEGAGEGGLGAAKGVVETGYSIGKMLGLVKSNPDFEKFLEARGGNELAGKSAERVLEFASGEGAVNAGVKAVPALAKVAKIPILGSALKGAVTGAGVTGLETGGDTGAMKTNAIIGGAAPALLETLGYIAKGAGSKILTAGIKPTLADRKDGFKAATIAKEGLGGLSLEDMANTVTRRIGELYKKASTMRGNATGTASFDDAAARAESELLSNPQHVRYRSEIKAALDKYVGDVAAWAKEAGVDTAHIDPATANILKSSFGKAGSFAAGDEANARELAANTIFSNLKTAIEDASGAGLSPINKRISDLIPIERAVYRRLGAEGNNAPIGVLPFIALAAGRFGDAALAVLQRSVGAGSGLLKAGETALTASRAAAPAVLGVKQASHGASGSY